MPVVQSAIRGRLRIVSDGTARTTVVYDANGKQIEWGASGLTKIEIFPIEPDGLVKAVLTIDLAGIDIASDALVAFEIKQTD